ncbi:general secretion pathway protein GspE [soil metagenome]
MKLGTLLLRNAAIGLSQLEGALRNQVLYGGRLGTNLVELGFIDLELLSSYLAELSGYPMATPSLLDEADPELLEKLGSEEAHRQRAIPLAYLGDAKDTIAVAMVDPTDAAALEQLADTLGAKITPYVVPELRALYYLERLFGTPRRARFVRSARPGSEAEPPKDDRRRQQPAQGMVMPPAFTLEPRRRRSSQQLTSGSQVPHTLSYSAACERIDTATHREQIADVFVDYAKGRCDALVVFLIRDGNAFGWRGWVAPPAEVKTPIDELSLPLGGASSLQSAHDAGEAFVGPSPSSAKPVETTLWAALGTKAEPIDVVVIPILVKQRAVNLVYAHTLGGPPPQFLITELLDLAVRAQASYLRLIKQARGS